MICRITPRDAGDAYTPEKMLADAKQYVAEHRNDATWKEDLKRIKKTNEVFHSLVVSVASKA